MKTSSSNDRIFGTLALVLFVTGILVPLVIDAFFGLQIASAFAFISLAMALIFGLMARRQKTAKVALVGLAALVVVATSTFAVVTAMRSARLKKMEAQQDVKQTTPPVLAEQPPERDK